MTKEAKEQSDNEKQELMFRLRVFEQQIRQINSQIQAIEQAVLDLNNLIYGLEELKGKTDKEILAPLGKGIFVKAKLISEKLLVDVGDKNLITKDIEGTKDIIKEQLIKLEEAKTELNKALEEINSEMMSMAEKIRRE